MMDGWFRGLIPSSPHIHIKNMDVGVLVQGRDRAASESNRSKKKAGPKFHITFEHDEICQRNSSFGTQSSR